VDDRRIIVELPDQLLTQMSTCQTAANEFLRQFWVSIFPTVQDMRNPGFSKSSEQREAKAVKMVAYLETTREKVEALLSLARQLDVDPAMVETVSRLLGRLIPNHDRALYRLCNR
jgi:transcription initiation factor TFIIH subunit 1